MAAVIPEEPDDAALALEAWDEESGVTFDRELWSELTTLRFLEDANNVLLMGPVGVGKTFMANALGNIACRRRRSVLMLRADRMLKRLKAARLDASHEAELRKLIRVGLLIVDDFALHQLDQTETQDVYDIVVERHRRTSTIVTSNRSPEEWLAVMTDPLLAQSAVDRSRARPTKSSWKVSRIDGSRGRAGRARDDVTVSMAASAWVGFGHGVVPCW